MDSFRIVFMGTPEFAVPSLEILVKDGFNVVAVVTAADKPQGRGQKIAFSPVKEAALRYQIPVLQPTNLKSPEFQNELKSFNADLQVVVAFRMLPESVWAMPRHGTFNLHASLLPQYRGAAPINWAVINGEKETGVTTFLLQHEIDTGNILFQEKEAIDENDTAGTLYTRLMDKGAVLVLKTALAIRDGNYYPVVQQADSEIKHAPKIFKETCEIRWENSVTNVRNFIRGLSPHPGAWTTIDGRQFKIFGVEEAKKIETETKTQIAAGGYVTDNKTFLFFRCSDGFLSILELQPEGKKRMKTDDFFRGNKL